MEFDLDGPLFRPVKKNRTTETDLLVHRPGTGENYAVIEVKSSHAIAREIDKDLGTLTLFIHGLGYQRAI